MSTPSTSPSRKPLLTTERLGLFVVVLASALAMSPNVADPDLWGHVQFGRDVLNNGEIPATTTYSYTAEDYRWINHENLSEIAMAIVVDAVGPLGLVTGKFALSLVVILAILWWNLRSGVNYIVSAVLTLMVAANLGYHWSIRPQLSSFVGFTCLVLLLNHSFAGWQGRWHLRWPKAWFAGSSGEDTQPCSQEALGYQSHRIRLLWLVPVLFGVWANAHGGFVAGLSIYCAYLAFRAVEAMCRLGSRGWGLTRRMVLMAAVAILATLINPYGPRLPLWLFESLAQPRPEISDWSNSELFSGIGLKLWILVACTCFGLFLTRRRLDVTQWVLIGLTLWQAVSHFRHVPFFAILVGFWLGPHLQSALERCSTASTRRRQASRAWTLAVQGCLVVAVGLVGWQLSTRLSDLQVRRDHYPVDAIAYMRENHLLGRTVVTYDWAQFTIAALCVEEMNPSEQATVAFDGRFRTCYPQTIVDMHFDFLYGAATTVKRHRSKASPPIDPSRILRHEQPDLVLLRRHGEHTEDHMLQHQADWVLLYQDAIAQVWGARRRFGNPASESFIAPERREIGDQLCTDSVRWPAIDTVAPPIAGLARLSPSE